LGLDLAGTSTGLDNVLVIEERLAGTMQAATGPQGAPGQGVETQDAQPKRSGLRRLFSKVVGERTVNRDEVSTQGNEPAPAATMAVAATPAPVMPVEETVAPSEPVAQQTGPIEAPAMVAPVSTPASGPAASDSAAPAAKKTAAKPTARAQATKAAVRPVPVATPTPDPEAHGHESASELTRAQIKFNRDAAAEEDVFSDVHPADHVYQALCKHPMLTQEQGARHYFSDGARSARQLVEILGNLPDLDPRSIDLLEFASGYGRVSRHLKKYPRLKLSCCDIHEPATLFLQDVLGVRAVVSDSVPEMLAVPQTYDVVFALGFFTQMPRSSFGRWIRALHDSLNSPGYLVFTTHGIKSCAHQGITPAELPADGFWYREASDEQDLDPAEYGTSVTTPDFVIGEIFRQTAAPIVEYRHGYWSGHQDLWVIQRQG